MVFNDYRGNNNKRNLVLLSPVWLVVQLWAHRYLRGGLLSLAVVGSILTLFV